MKNSKIEWTDHTANFWWGCVKVSPGCQNCYAEGIVKRFGKGDVWGPAKTTGRRFMPGAYKKVRGWNREAEKQGKRYRVFVQSMSDIYEDHPDVNEWRQQAFSLMRVCSSLDFQVLTKRPENILRFSPTWSEWPDNIWVGTSVEDQRRADERIPELLKVAAKTRFLSCEPLLGPVNLGLPFSDNPYMVQHGIDWVIVGGESGPKKRPFDCDWARDIRDQCANAGIPFFMKQVDKVQPIPDDLMIREFPKRKKIDPRELKL